LRLAQSIAPAASNPRKGQPMTRRTMMKTLASAASAVGIPASAPAQQRKIADGIFKPAWDSLKQYNTPDWFRDAKFGTWAHWSAQCVP
jgi:alpha-L-fucosidase